MTKKGLLWWIAAVAVLALVLAACQPEASDTEPQGGVDLPAQVEDRVMEMVAEEMNVEVPEVAFVSAEQID
ncbi:MAG: hypothetical protein L0331_28225, partial [Chloroflexi bacterium]|nr:hypothetical protein [Chloroflexota bacterium]